MSNKQAAASADASVSPYLSFRQAIRPAIFANSLLLREQGRAGELADTANQILALTRDLMRKAGLGYIATPGKAALAGEGDGIGRLDSLLDAFTDAAMMWAEVIGGCVVLADGLLAQGRLDEVRILAAVLADSGEAGTARELIQRLTPATSDKYKKRLARVHSRMKPAEIQNAIDALTEALTEIPASPERDYWLNSFLPALAASVLPHIENDANIYQVQSIAEEGLTVNLTASYISDIAAAFRAADPRHQ